jgi:hypothetical protein
MTIQQPRDVSHSTRLKFGALALSLSALLFLSFQLFHPISSLDLSAPDAATRTFASSTFVLTDSLLIIAFSLLPLGLLTVYAILAGSRGERWGMVALVLMLLALGPFQAFSGVGAFAFSAASQVYQQGKTDALAVLATLINGPSVPFGMVGVALLVLGALALAVAIWRSGTLPRWAGALFALGFVLFLPAVASPASVQKALRVIDSLASGIGGLWLAWAVWRR